MSNFTRIIAIAAVVLLVWLNVWYYSLPQEERDENERDMWIW